MAKNLSPNPATWFITGSDTDSFTFEPGREMFVVSVSGDHHHMLTLILFADSREHVITILRDMANFRIDCYKRYESTGRQPVNDCGHAYQLLDLLDDKLTNLKLEIETPGKNRVFKTTWASNSTVL